MTWDDSIRVNMAHQTPHPCCAQSLLHTLFTPFTVVTTGAWAPVVCHETGSASKLVGERLVTFDQVYVGVSHIFGKLGGIHSDSGDLGQSLCWLMRVVEGT